MNRGRRGTGADSTVGRTPTRNAEITNARVRMKMGAISKAEGREVGGFIKPNE